VAPDGSSKTKHNSEDHNNGHDRTFFLEHVRRVFADEMSLTSVDLLEELRAALDAVEPLIVGHVVDIEMSRLRVLADPVLFRQEFASLIQSAVADAEPTRSITIRVSRTGKSARIDVLNESDGAQLDDAIGSMTLPLAPGASSAADA
jgi:light-regulated signal transduction histidine kinase (bacteriophytochrome)